MWTRRCTETLIFFLCFFSAGAHDCLQSRCSRRGPTIRFPFSLKSTQPEPCGYPGFDLSCTNNLETVLDLPLSVRLVVRHIDYKSRLVHVFDSGQCLPKLARNLNLTSTPFRYFKRSKYLRGANNYTLFSCGSEPVGMAYDNHFPCLASSTPPGDKVFVFYSDSGIEDVTLISCIKMYDLVGVQDDIFYERKDLVLSWSKPDCEDCEEKGEMCRLMRNSTRETECYKLPKPHKSDRPKQVVLGSVLGSLSLVLAATALFWLWRARKLGQEHQLKIEKFLADYEAFKPTRYSYADIKRITNQFSDELGQGAYGTVYKGRLSEDVHVAVKLLNNSKGKGEEFVNEVTIICRIHHINVVRLVGFCADGFRRALVYEFLPNGSLQNFLSITTKDDKPNFLGWKKTRDVALGIAKGIEYLHQGCDQQILHFDIKPHNIMLDENFNPKISDFGLAKLCSKDQTIISMTTARGTLGYIAPEVFSRNFGNVSYKSDVYSFGMLLLDMLNSGMEFRNVAFESSTQFDFPTSMYNHLEQGRLNSVLIRTAESEEDAEIAEKVAIVGLWCVQWRAMDRPSMDNVVKMLEGRMELNMPPCPLADNKNTKLNRL